MKWVMLIVTELCSGWMKTSSVFFFQTNEPSSFVLEDVCSSISIFCFDNVGYHAHERQFLDECHVIYDLWVCNPYLYRELVTLVC